MNCQVASHNRPSKSMAYKKHLQRAGAALHSLRLPGMRCCPPTPTPSPSLHPHACFCY